MSDSDKDGCSKRVAAQTQRYGSGLSTGRIELYKHDRVTAPYAGCGRYPGRVESVHVHDKTVHVVFDDGDIDEQVKIASVLHEQGAVAVLPRKIKGGFSVRPPAKKLRLLGQPRRKRRQWAILDVVKIHILPPAEGTDHYDDVAKRMMIHFTWLWQASDTRLEDHPPRTSTVTLFDVVNTVPAPYNNMHVVALRQFCLQLAQKPCVAAMQIQVMFGTYDPAEYQ
jgi:hypothetical protein